MSYTTNRLEQNWERLRPFILEQWPRLNLQDLELTGGHFDRLVEVIRQRYGGRVEIIQEASIRDTLNQILAQLSSDSASESGQ